MLPFRSVRCVSNASVRFFSLFSGFGGASVKGNTLDSSESADDFGRRIFGDSVESDSKTNSFFKKLEKVERFAKSKGSDGQFFHDLNENYYTLDDGLDGKLKNAATSFWFDEMEEESYKYRPDVTFYPGTTYDTKDLDLTKPVVHKFPPKKGFSTTTEEVLKKADFRNARFLANFITEAGIIIKRKKTGISAKAQRRVAREIKTARAFGLMPFISMGTKPFVFGRSMKEEDPIFQYDDYYRGRVDDAKYGINKEDPESL